MRGERSTWISFSPNAASLSQAEPGLRLLHPCLEATAASAQNRTEQDQRQEGPGHLHHPCQGEPQPTASPSRAAQSNPDKGWAQAQSPLPAQGVRAVGGAEGGSGQRHSQSETSMKVMSTSPHHHHPGERKGALTNKK